MSFLLKQTDEIRANSEEEAKTIMEYFKKEAEKENYVVSSYAYKTKKTKDKIVDEAWVVKIIKQIAGVWDE